VEGNNIAMDLKESWCIFEKIQVLKLQNYAGSKQNSCRIMRMQIFASAEQAKLHPENTRGLNLTAVRNTTVRLTKI
jgi:hypothetical protein